MPSTAQATTSAAADSCFHCSLPLPPDVELRAQIDGARRSFCCPGCRAIAQTIADRGLGSYYRLRSADAAQPRAEEAGQALDLQLYDDAAVQSRFVRDVPSLANTDGAATAELREADLLLEDMRCAACAWLIEQTLSGLPGVQRAEVVYATGRARVVWDARATRLSALMAAIRAVGYRAWPYEPGRIEQMEKRERHDALWRLFVAGFGMMQVMMYALPVYLADEGSMSADIEQLMRWAGLILTLPVVLYSAAPFFAGARRDLLNVRSLRTFSPGMDLPVALGIAVAFAASLWSTVVTPGPVYFDSVAMFVFLLLGGRYLELLARQQSGRSLQKLARLIPETAHRLDGLGSDSSSQSQTVPVALIRPGDRVLVRPGETIPADGALESASATVNEALLSGESRPVAKSAGSHLTGGAVNTGSALIMRVARVGADTALSAITRMAGRALAERPRWVAMANHAAGLFVIVILLCALGAGVAWMWIDPSRALWVAVSVLIVTCPCALSLATPAAMAVAVGEMAARGLVIARGRAVEALADVTDCVFDKTGTLTEGRPTLLEVRPLDGRSQAECLGLAAAVEQGSEHPLAQALRVAAQEKDEGRAMPQASDYRSMHGAGVEALIGGVRHRIGSADYVSGLHGRTTPLAWLHGGDTVAWLGDESGWIAAFRFGDGLRPESLHAVTALRAMGKRVHLLSGDAPEVAQRVANELGLDADLALGGATPDGKLAYVRGLQAGGAKVAMVGDGVNDAPVLAQADVSVALGGGSDLAQITADAVLLSDSPKAFAQALALASHARKVIRQNLAWALSYNLVVLPLAFAGMVTPLAAGIGMSASSLLVVLNALRLKHSGSHSG